MFIEYVALLCSKTYQARFEKILSRTESSSRAMVNRTEAAEAHSLSIFHVILIDAL